MEQPIIDQDEILHEDAPLYATFWERVGASFVDGLIMIPVIIFTYYNSMSLKSLPLALVAGVIPTVYKVYMEGKYGATIGKRNMKIIVRTAGGETIGMQQALVRNSLYIIAMVVSLIDSIIVFGSPGFEDVSSFGELSAYQNIYGMSFGFLPSLVILISVLFVAFDKHKQALHDKIAKTYCCIR